MNQPVTNAKPIEERIEGAIDTQVMSMTNISQEVGGLQFTDMGQVMEFAKLMSVSKQAVPSHLRGQPGACMAVSLQALNWRMDPFAVANKSYMVKDRISYEAQLIQAVIEQRAPIKGRIKGDFIGEGGTRVCVLRVISIEDGETIEYRSPEISKITVKNSPLWVADPDQQLWYYSARAMCRRHFPDVLLGVYAKDEVENAAPIRTVNPDGGGLAAMAEKARDEAATPQEAEPEAEEIPLEAEIEDAEVLPAEHEFDPEAMDAMTDEYSEGVKSNQAGLGEDTCPHEPNSYDCNNWIGGWRFSDEQKGGS